MHDRLAPSDPFKFCEITNNVSETVTDREMKSYAAYRMASIRMTLSDLEGHCSCFKPF